MFFLNLSLFQFLAVFGSISAISVALYLLDRSRRKQVVSTLRFWVAAEQPAVAARRRHISQPWSLILQLLSMALLLLAIAQLRLGTPGRAGRDHVIILETSAWMAAKSGKSTLMDLAKDRAHRYLHALPVRDRVMLIRADAMATPATAFEPCLLYTSELMAIARKAGMQIPSSAPGGGDAGRAPADAAGEPSGGSVFTNVQKLGLKLESRKSPLSHVVVDHVEKDPTEN